MSELANQLIKKALEENATYLDLGNCGLTDLGEIPMLFQCVQLETLILSSEWYDYADNENEIFSENKGNPNELKKLPVAFRRLKNLKVLVCSGCWGILNIPNLKDLTNLMYLDLSYNSIINTSFLKDLPNLTYLYLGGNLIIDISFLKNLENLTSLDLNSNQITDIPVLKDLKNLTSLNLNSNEITDIAVLKNLKNLANLDLGLNLITDISVLKYLKNLTNLKLIENECSDISCLKNLKNLITIDLSEMGITDISVLADLINLTHLDLSYNQIKDISVLKNLVNLEDLYLANNPIYYIPKEVYQLYNPINSLKSYWQNIESSQKTTNTQLKIMFLGNGCTGKTTLLHWFIDNAFKDIDLKNRTEGIIIQPLPLCAGKTLGNFWDFGGQEVYHATHRLFLGRRTLYILVWATDTPERIEEQRHPPQYWLDMIADIADKREPSRVLIVQNLFDKHAVQHSISNEEMTAYTAQGLEISTISVNAKTGHKIKSFKLNVEEEVENLLNTYQEELPETWVNIRTAVAKRRENKEKTLTFADFEQICVDCKLVGDPSVILGYLHRAGEVYYYAHQFQNKIILDQEWALKAVYAVLKRKRIDRYKGIFQLDDLIDIWQDDNPDLTKEDAQIFLNFMLSNQIMFYTDGGSPSEDNKRFVIPQLLEDKTPLSYKTNKGKADNLMHRIEYTFLHRDIIERFIVRTAQFCKEKEYWRNGVFIEYQNSFAIVEAIKEEKTIHIECFGQGKGLLLQKIREEFDKICPLEKAKEYQIVNGETRPFNDEMPRQHDTKKGGLSDEAFEKTLSVKIENATNTALENIPLFKNNYTSNSMTTEHLKDQVRSLISKAKTKGAMDLVATWAHENNQEQLKSDIALLKGDFTDLSREKTLGLLGNSEANTRQNQLNNKVLSLVNNVEIPIKKEEQDTTSKIDNSMIKNTLSGKSLNIFLSYSHKDEELKEQLDTHLAALKRNNLIQTWNDRAILTGEEWDIAIKTQLAQADIILLLVSANFIASEYIWKVEITQAMKRHDNKEVVVVPVFIKPCDWKGMPFEKLQGLPKDAIPVTKHNDRDEVLMTIAKSIRSLVERLTA